MRPPAKDVIFGVGFVVVGGCFAAMAMHSLDVGNRIKLGPGVFPLAASALLVFFGTITALGFGTSHEIRLSPPPWRALSLIVLAPVAFAVTVRGLGLAPALGIATFIASFASRRISLLQALVITGALLLITILVFSFGLSLPYPLLGYWLGR